MNQQELSARIEEYKKTDWAYLLRTDLGGEYDLKQLATLFNGIKQFVDDIIDHPCVHELSDNDRQLVNQMIVDFKGIIGEVERYSDVNTREQVIESIKNQQNHILTSYRGLRDILDTFDQYGSVGDVSSRVARGQQSPRQLQNLRKEYQKLKAEFEEIKSSMKATAGQQQTKVLTDESSKYGNFFAQEAKRNEKRAKSFGIAAILCVFVFVAFAIWGWFCFPTPEIKNVYEFLSYSGFYKLFIFTIMLMVLNVLKNNFMAYSHLKTLNTHRHNAIASHKEILKSIQDTKSESDKETANTILVELTKAMFNAEDTGFVARPTTASNNKTVEVYRTFKGGSV